MKCFWAIFFFLVLLEDAVLAKSGKQLDQAAGDLIHLPYNEKLTYVTVIERELKDARDDIYQRTGSLVKCWATQKFCVRFHFIVESC